MSSIFVNFRNGDEPFAAALVYRALSQRFGADAVFRSSDSVAPGTKWAEGIWANLDASDVFVAIIGPRWLTVTDESGRPRIKKRNDWVRMEVARALRDGKHVIPILVNGAPRPNVRDLPKSLRGLAARQAVALDHRDVTGCLDRLIAEATVRLPGLGLGPHTPHRIHDWLDTWNVPARTPSAVDRDDVCAEVVAALDGDAFTVLHGGVGSGKTHVATEIAYRYAGSYGSVWWIDGEQPSLLGPQLAALGRALGLEPAGEARLMTQTVFAALRRRGPYLLIIDGLEDPHALRDLLAALGPGAHALVTSRRAEWGLLPTRGIALRPLRRTEARALLPRLADAEADTLAAALDDIPLALTQAATLLAAGPVTPAEYAALVSTRTRELMRLGETYLYPRSLGAAWTVGLEALPPEASRLVCLLAFVAPAPLPLDVISSGSRSGSSAGWDGLAVTAGLRALTASGLVAVEAGAVRAHGLFQRFVREGIAPPAAAALRDEARSLLSGATRGDPRGADSDGRYAALLPHAVALDLVESADPACQRMLLDVVQHLNVRADAATALDLARSAARRWAERHGPDADADATMDATALAAQAYFHLGRFAEALPLDRSVHAHLAGVHGPDDPRTLYAAHNLAITSWAAGLPVLAEIASVQARRSATLGPDHPDTLRSAHNLGLALRSTGEYARAREVDTETLAGFTAALGPDHPDTLRSAYALALDLTALGDASAARALHTQTAQLRGSVLGPDHPDTLRSGYALAAALRAAGDPGCLDLAREVHVRRATVLGAAHIDTLRAGLLLGAALVSYGDAEAGRSLTATAAEALRLQLAELTSAGSGSVRMAPPPTSS